MSLLQLKKFDPRTIGDDKCIFIASKRGGGKSNLAKCICFFKKHIPMGIIMNGTEEATKSYAPFCPDLFIFTKWEPKQVEMVMARQKRSVHEGRPLTSVFIVMDDIAYNKSLFTDKVFRELIMNGRPLKIFVLCCVQFVGDLPPAIRENVDFLFVLKSPGKNLRKRLYDNFFGGLVDTFPMFCNIMDSTTENYEALVLDNTKQSNKLSDCLFWYKAFEPPPFRMGSQGFWRQHDKKYDSKYYQKTLNPSKELTVKVVKKGKKAEETKATKKAE